ncbi:MAG: CopG family transcriptional regulator [Acaryochloris sp. RU_4_1]|nr:CopG family transcriptional regulator [Acaryochloris sp. RU_4_1]NJR55290.1 CopG family transcriptional regulator [Acaryochloris sp. CRU_2_0]
MRINARLDDEYVLKLNYLQRQTEKSVTEIIKLALDAYYQEFAQQKHPIDILADSGFIGCGEAGSHLSTDYKSELTDSLEDKYGLTQ